MFPGSSNKTHFCPTQALRGQHFGRVVASILKKRQVSRSTRCELGGELVGWWVGGRVRQGGRQGGKQGERQGGKEAGREEGREEGKGRRESGFYCKRLHVGRL